MNKKILILLILAVVAAAVFGVWQYQQTRVGSGPDGSKDPGQEKVSIKQVDLDKLPESFPSSMPLETNAKITENYNATQGNRLQATRTFVTAKTLKQNFDLYKKWLADNGWTVTASMDQETLKALAAKKRRGTP